jgi:hypothetical protein
MKFTIETDVDDGVMIKDAPAGRYGVDRDGNLWFFTFETAACLSDTGKSTTSRSRSDTRVKLVEKKAIITITQ